jgi:ABC-2 type transport system ATP-binding protein
MAGVENIQQHPAVNNMILQTHNLTRRYGNNTALDNVSFEIADRASVGLVGKNGAGKTTLLSIIAGLLRPTSGTVAFDGRTSGTGLGLQPQEECFRRNISVLRQLRHLQRLQPQPAAETGDDLERLLTDLDVRDYAARSVAELSFGQRKRLNILQAFLGRPGLILLDEPTAGLDPIAAATVKEMIRTRARDATFLISSHNLYELQDLCQRVLVLDNGKLVNDIDLLRRADMDSILRLKLDREVNADLLSRMTRLTGITQVTTDRHDASRITLLFADARPDQLQLAVQSLINESGYSILQLSRGKTLSDDMAGLQ